jgi:hypothetical protein
MSGRAVAPSVSLIERLARLFREPAAGDAGGTRAGDGGSDRPAADGGAGAGGTTAVAVVVQSPPAGVRRYELTVRADAPVAGVDPDLLTLTFETTDLGTGAVRVRAVDVEGRGKAVDAAPLFVVRFAETVDPATVSLDGHLDGHDEEAVPWSRVRLTPVD